MPGEVVEGFVYLHAYGDPTTAIVTGLPTNIATWIAARTNRRVLIFRGDGVNAARSRLAAAYPLAEVTVSVDRPGKPTKLGISAAGRTATFSVPLIWRSDAATFAEGLSTT